MLIKRKGMKNMKKERKKQKVENKNKLEEEESR